MLKLFLLVVEYSFCYIIKINYRTQVRTGVFTLVGNDNKVRIDLNEDRLCVKNGMETKDTSLNLVQNLLRARDIQTGQNSTVLFGQGTGTMEIKI